MREELLTQKLENWNYGTHEIDFFGLCCGKNNIFTCKSHH